MIGDISTRTSVKFVSFGSCIAALFVALFLVIPSQPAGAALCARWVSPTQAVSGDVAIAFETLVPWSTGAEDYELQPEVFEDYPFDVVAVGPAGQRQTVDVAPDPEDATVWGGALSNAVEGEWTITIQNFESGTDSACYTPHVIHVTGPPLNLWLIGGAVLAFATATGLVYFARQQRLSSGLLTR